MAIGLKKTKHSTPPRILLHGGPKVGKSTLCSSIPGSVFLPCEDGLNGLEGKAILDLDSGKTRYETYEEFMQGLAWAVNNLDAYKALVIDTGDWLEQLIFKKVCADYQVKTIEMAAGGYGKGYTEALGHWQAIIQTLDFINRSGKIVVVICHSKAIPFNDPEHEPYDVWEIKLHASKGGNGALTLLKEWADIIAFMSREKFVSKKEGATKVSASETGRRLVHVEGSAGFLAGNRYSMSSPLPANWEAIKTELLSNTSKAT